MEIKNWGNTPADVTDVVIRPQILEAGEKLSPKPSYNRQRTEKSFHAFLVKGDNFSYINPELFNVGSITEKIAITGGNKELFIFGYVDYIDKFGVHHRAGYARRFDYRAAMRGHDNLVFVSQSGYNYDHERKRGDGNGWDEQVPS